MKTKPTPERIARKHTSRRQRQKPEPKTTEVRAHFDLNDLDGQLIAEHGDPYEAIAAATTTKQPQYLSVHSSGWAAPHQDGDPEVPPSLHPHRQRVHLALVIDTRTRKLTSVMRWSNKKREPVVSTHDSEQSGALAQAVFDLAERIAAQH